MEMKELFESTYEIYKAEPPEVFYVCGDKYLVYVISKYNDDKHYSLNLLEVFEKNRICLRVDDFDKLMDIVNLLTYSDDKVYYERLVE